jgi:membrane protein DedA with SNARE-associated domain
VTALIANYGAFGVFLLMVPESACIPIPSEVTLLFSGFAVSQHWMSFPIAVLAATAGNVVGSLIAYAGGACAAARLPRARNLLRRSESLLGDKPLKAVFTARLLPLARSFVSLPAGARHLPLGPFTALTAAGCGIWATAFTLAGLTAGAAWASVSGIAGKALLAVGLVVLATAAWRGTRGPRGRTDG